MVHSSIGQDERFSFSKEQFDSAMDYMELTDYAGFDGLSKRIGIEILIQIFIRRQCYFTDDKTFDLDYLFGQI